MNQKIRHALRVAALFSLTPVLSFAETGLPFFSALHSLRLDSVDAATDLGIIVIIIGGILMACGGGRAIAGIAGVVCGAFIALCATPIATALQKLGGG